MPPIPHRIALALVLVAPTGLAQDVSIDGNRWVEVEVTVYRTLLAGVSSEVPNPRNLGLGYLPRVQPLMSPAESYAYPFENDRPAPPVLAPAFPAFPETPVQEELPPPREFGARYSPAREGAFRLADLATDAFIALDGSRSRFTTINRNLEQSGAYRVLWHAVWRQPLLAPGQTRAVGVVAGEQVNGHAQLEGSLRLSDAGRQARLELDVWLNEFGALTPDDAARWSVPAMPQVLAPATDDMLPGADPVDTLPPRGIVGVWQNESTRELTPNELYYFDHPVLGVLVETRPYRLPEPEGLESAEDF